MQHSLLITGATRPQRREKAEEIARKRTGAGKLDTCVDFLLVTREEEKKHIGIDTAREIKQWVKTKPTHEGKVVIIPNAEELTVEAQNALLKTLEEPPTKTTLVLCVPHKQYLLPTVISRCAHISLTDKPTDLLDPKITASKSSFIGILKRTPGERLDWVAANAAVTQSPEELLNRLTEWLIITRDLLLCTQNVPQENLTLTNVTDTRQTASLLTASAWLETAEKLYNARTLVTRVNVDRRLALEVLLLELPQLQHSS